MTKVPKIFVTGWPVRHSLSPLIHSYWLEYYGIKGHCHLIETSVQEFPSFVQQIQELGFLGGNITLPHKEIAFTLVKECDDNAHCIGAVNTIWIEKSILHGSNTDSYGFSRNLDEFCPEWARKKSALVLGAGGGCRAILFALLERKYKQIIIANRTRSRAENLSKHFGKAVIVTDWDKISFYISKVDLIINTTSIGMIGQKGKQTWLDFSIAKPETVVTDIVYTPLKTPFLQRAEDAGLKTIDGLGMLLHQAVPGFERWFCIRPAVTKELRMHVISHLKDKQ